MRDEHSSCKPGPCRVGADQEERTALLPIHASDSLRTESGGYGNERAIQVCTAHTTEAQGSYRSPRLRWCRRRDLNPHGLRHTPLKRACLPFHHFGNRIREAYLVKRRSFPDSDASRFTNYAQQPEGAAL